MTAERPQESSAASRALNSATDLESSWLRAWRGIGATGDGRSTYEALVSGYREPHRRYHTVQHLAECLAAFQQVADLAPHPAEVEMALWFHDAVYDVKRHDNEERSAEWAVRALTGASAKADSVATVSSLVLATKHAAEPTTPDAQLLVDIDLAILGASEDRFAEYERQIREEYAYVPGFVFRSKRRAILTAFLQRRQIYSTAHFHARLEQAARQNLQRAIGCRLS